MAGARSVARAAGGTQRHRGVATTRTAADRHTTGGRSLTEPAESTSLALEAFQRGQAEIAAGNRSEACRWLDRACRLAPGDQTLALALATACLGLDDRRAANLFAAIVTRNDVREAWLGLAVARWQLDDSAGAADALAMTLRRHVADQALTALANAIVLATGAPGWCGLSSDGALTVRPADMVPLPSNPLRAEKRRSASTSIPVIGPDGRHFLGSPINAAAIAATTGCVWCQDGGLAGWAWHPGDPNRDPQLTIRPARGGGRLTVTASDTGIQANGSVLGRPRGFSLPAIALSTMKGPLRVLGADGRDLLGSPLDPRATPAAMPVNPLPGGRPRSSRRPPVDVVVPVHGGGNHTMACLESVLASIPRRTRLIVVDDASQEPELLAALDGLARRRRVRLIRHHRNRGFPASANDGMRAAADRDVVLLNSDTRVPPGWLEELRAVAYSASDIGTVTPLSNDATILSYPHAGDGNDLPDEAEAIHVDAMARRANGGIAIDIPVGVGFCMYIRRACLDSVGLFRADLFAQGYGEENDFCLRARHTGWRHVAAPGVFVAHVGGQSFGATADHLRARNAALLEQLHPGYMRLIEAHVLADPLAAARRRLDLARWRAARRRGSQAVVLITHDAGGGVERQIAASVERHRADGFRAVVLRPARVADGRRCVTVGDGTGADFPNLRYVLPDELRELRNLLLRERPRAIELHHLVGHHPAVVDLIADLAVPYTLHVHDYAWFCARVALVGPAARYCGEPNVERCEACVAEAGNLIDEDISVATLRRRSARLLAGAYCVVVPSDDAAARMRRHFPTVRPLVQSHEDDADVRDPPPSAATTRCRVCVIGAIGIHKGYQVLLDCARDAAERSLPLDFVVVGHTIDDRSLLATDRVFITGSYGPDEAVALIRAQQANLALLPSIFPETWCRSLTEAWRAGLRVAAFDIGAQAERIRRTGRGVLLPLGLAAAEINNALVAEVGLSRHEWPQSSQHATKSERLECPISAPLLPMPK